MRQAEGAEIGRRIAQARREAGLTQEELAELVGVTQRSIQGYEAGKVVPYRHFSALEQATGRPLAWFLRGEEAEATPLDAVGDRLLALVEQVASEAERLAEIAARLESRLAQAESPRGSAARR